MIVNKEQAELPVLTSSKYEHFAQLVATGQSPAQAYAAAGYEEKTAYTCGPRLLKRPEVRSRVTELQRTVAQTSGDAVILNRDRVLNRLSQLSHEAQRRQTEAEQRKQLEAGPVVDIKATEASTTG